MKRKLFAWMMAISFAFTNVNSFVFAEEGTEEPAATEETSQEETAEPEQTETTEEVVQEEETDGESIQEPEGEKLTEEPSETAQEQTEATVEEPDSDETVEAEKTSFENEKPEPEEAPIEEKEEVQEQDYSAGETDVSNFKYTISEGKITITRYTGSDSDVVIPSTIEGNPVICIGNSAFEGCTSLANITIPDSVTSIGNYAFSYCTGLTSIAISAGVTNIGNSAFAHCTGLTSITIPDSVTNIGNSAFTGCSGLTSFTVPDGVERIDDYAFSECYDLINIYLPNSLKFIGSHAFASTDLRKIIIPESVCEIGEGVFSGCNNLSKVDFLCDLEEIGDGFFCGCHSLTRIIIPETVKYIGDSAFAECKKISNIIIPDSVISIGDFAFSFCKSLEKVSIGENAQTIGDFAFSYCDNLKEIYFSGYRPNFGKEIFGNNKEFNAYYPYGESTWLGYLGDYGAENVIWESLTAYIVMSETRSELLTNESLQLKAVIKPDYYYDVNWLSSNKKVATVDENGVITAKTYGKTTITLMSRILPNMMEDVMIQTRFYDVNDSTQSYYKAVYWGADNGVVAGYDGGVYFGPDNVCTRAQFVTFLWRLAGRQTGDKDVSFPDVDPNESYYRAVKWAVSEGIIVGFKHDNGPATFEPNGTVTRGQVATMLWRFAGRKTPTLPSTSPFSDINASNSSYRAVVWGQKAGVIKGYKDGTFQPDASCLRQHIVTFLYRYARDVMKKKV